MNADKFKAGLHPGYEPNALEGLRLSIKVASERGIKIIVNGGSLNPEGMAIAVASMVREQKLSLKVGWVSGDDVLPGFQKAVKSGVLHLDGDNEASFLSKETAEFVKNPSSFEVVSANAYIGARGIKRALDLGCDIIICTFMLRFMVFTRLKPLRWKSVRREPSHRRGMVVAQLGRFQFYSACGFTCCRPSD